MQINVPDFLKNNKPKTESVYRVPKRRNEEKSTPHYTRI